MPIRFGREISRDLDALEAREWLVTNGIGGYGSGSAAGSLTRGYHGLLVASLSPPTDRRVMLVKLDETLACAAGIYELATNRWVDGSVSPQGYLNLQSFELDGSVPVWTFACAEVLLEKRVWMKAGQNTTYIEYTLVAATGPVTLSIRAIADNRIFHNTSQVAWPTSVTSLPDGVKVLPPTSGGLSLTVRASTGTATAAAELYSGFHLPAEVARGLNGCDSHVHVVTFTLELTPGATVQLLGSAEDAPEFDTTALATRRARMQRY